MNEVKPTKKVTRDSPHARLMGHAAMTELSGLTRRKQAARTFVQMRPQERDLLPQRAGHRHAQQCRSTIVKFVC
jgi:hypothetical protein